MEEEERQDTDRHIEALWRAVNHNDRDGRPVYIVPLVLCHDSFSQTIENMFALSFLVRDGRVRFAKTPAGLQVIPVSRQQRGEGTAHLERRQAIMTVSVSDWKNMKKTVPASACLLPNRCSGAAADDGVAAAVARRAGGTATPHAGTRAGAAVVSSGKRGASSKRTRTVLGSTENVLQVRVLR